MKKTFTFSPDGTFAYDFAEAAHLVALGLVRLANRIIGERGQETFRSIFSLQDHATETMVAILTAGTPELERISSLEHQFQEAYAIGFCFSKSHGGDALLLKDGEEKFESVIVTSLLSEQVVTCVLATLDACGEGRFTVVDNEKLTRRAGYFLTQPVSYL